MSENANTSKSPLCTILIVVISLAVGFAAGHIASDMGLIGGAPKLPEAKQGDGSSPPRERDPYPAQEEAEKAIDNATEEAEEVVDDAKQKLDDATGG